MINSSPRIYVASLADYNAGRLHGVWIDLEGLTADDIVEEVEAMLNESKEPIAEEWAIHDHEDLGGRIDEYTSFTEIAAIVEKLEETYDEDAFLAWLGYEERSIDDLEDFEEEYCGQWRSFEDYAENLAEELGLVNEDHSWPNSYIDWERAARDLEMDGYTQIEAGAPDYGVYVFRWC